MTEVNLRDYLLAGLRSSGVPGRRKFHLHVLVGGERRCGTLYPYASGRKQKVRVGVRDVVVVLSEETMRGEGARVITCGIEAALYRIPETSSGILYVSKVDSTGHGMKPSVTGVLVRRFVRYFVDEETRNVYGVRNMWVHVFARAQGEYLFLGSKEWRGKRVLGDVGLCGWWKRCLGDVGGLEGVRRWYVLPGLSEGEAEEVLRATGGGWAYGHPYGQTEVPLPCPGEEGCLERIIPCFEDDPKSRFMDELANDDGGVLRKRRRLDGEQRARTVGVDEFWERMGFRQECVAGALTGFFTVLAWGSSGGGGGGAEGIGKPRRGEVSERTVQRVVGLLKSGGIDFSTEEKAERATEVVESTVRGLCEGILYAALSGDREKTPERRTGVVGALTPNPFPEPVASLDTYLEWIYGSTESAGSSTIISPTQAHHVTRLVPRRKPKK